ncbi:branched-chain amino acid ABC transporter [Perkinsela sp. CCAP 1560/4]|nr:branched-chain amino acid ABC transporter [Perkinsela sp. CCAP 1560/4]|eukprot:KNH07580.1 branched-chain amino acid ABC transporter [Perkinsela sp. CCAP 1560/4]
MKREELFDVVTIDSYTDPIPEKIDANFPIEAENDPQTIVGTPFTINCFHLLRAVESARRKTKEISAFYASIHSGKLFVGTSDGAIIMLDANGVYLDCFHASRSRRITYLAEVRESCLLILDDTMRLEFWEIDTHMKMICMKKLPKMVPKHIRHVCYPERESIVLILVIDDGIVLTSSCVDGSTVLTSLSFCICQKGLRVSNISACADFSHVMVSQEQPSDTKQTHGELEMLLSILTEQAIALIRIRMDRETCHCENFSHLEILDKSQLENVHFSWAKPMPFLSAAKSFSSRVFLCTNVGETLKIFVVEPPQVAMLFEKKLDCSIDLLHWVDSFTLVAMNLMRSEILVLDVVTRRISSFTSPTAINKIQNRRSNRWNYVVQSHEYDIFIGNLPVVHHVRLQISGGECLTATSLNQSTSSYLIESHILRRLRFEEAQYQRSPQACVVRGVSSREVHFFRPVQELVDFYLTCRPNGHLIVQLFNLFKAFRLEDIFIFTLEFLVCEGRVDTLPQSLTDLLCERFSGRFDEFLPLEKVCLLVSPSSTDKLMNMFLAGRLYRLELCLANLTGDFGYTLRKALEFDLYIVLCTHHNYQFSDFRGPLRKLRTIGTNEALHTMMEYMLLLSLGKTFGSSTPLEASVQNDLKVEMTSHLLEINFGMQLLQVDAAKFLALFDVLLLHCVERKKLTKYLLRIEESFDGSFPGYSPSVIDRIVWHMHRLKYVHDGLLVVENSEENVIFTVFQILKLYEQLTVDAEELHELFSKRAAYSPSYPQTIYDNEMNSVERILRKTLNNLVDGRSSAQCTPSLCQASFLFHHIKNSESFQTIKKYHEWELLNYFIRWPRAEENASLLLSLPQGIQAEFNYLFTGLHFMRSGGLQTLQWSLSSKFTDGGSVLFRFISAIIRSADSLNSKEALKIVLMHCSSRLLEVNAEKTASLFWKFFPECHTILMKLQHDNKCLDGYLQGALSLARLSCNTFVEKWGLLKALHMQTSRDSASRLHSNFLKVFYANLDQAAMDTLVESHPISAYRLVRALLDNRLITEQNGASRLEKIPYVGAHALSLALRDKSHEALIILQRHVEVVWKEPSSHPDNCVVDGFCLRLQQLGETLDAILAVFHTINGTALSTELNTFCTFVSSVDAQPQLAFDGKLHTLPQLHKFNRLANWISDISKELRLQGFGAVSMQLDPWKNLVRNSFKVITTKFVSVLIRSMLDKIPPSDVWRNISAHNESLVLPLLLQQSKSALQMLEYENSALKSKEGLLISQIERKCYETGPSMRVYVQDPLSNSDGEVHFSVPFLACFPCRHLVESYQRYEECPICASHISQATGHAFQQNLQCATVETRLKYFREATDSFLFGNVGVNAFLENVQNEPEADLPSHFPVKYQARKSLNLAMEIDEVHLLDQQEDPACHLHTPEIRICLTPTQGAAIFGTH